MCRGRPRRSWLAAVVEELVSVRSGHGRTTREPNIPDWQRGPEASRGAPGRHQTVRAPVGRAGFSTEECPWLNDGGRSLRGADGSCRFRLRNYRGTCDPDDDGDGWIVVRSVRVRHAQPRSARGCGSPVLAVVERRETSERREEECNAASAMTWNQRRESGGQ